MVITNNVSIVFHIVWKVFLDLSKNHIVIVIVWQVVIIVHQIVCVTVYIKNYWSIEVLIIFSKFVVHFSVIVEINFKGNLDSNYIGVGNMNVNTTLKRKVMNLFFLVLFLKYLIIYLNCFSIITMKVLISKVMKVRNITHWNVCTGWVLVINVMKVIRPSIRKRIIMMCNICKVNTNSIGRVYVRS